MEDDDRTVQNESNNVLLSGELQLEEANGKILGHQNSSNQLINGQGSNQCTAVLKHCKNVHIGPKIEYHNHPPTTSQPIKIEKTENSIFLKCKERLKNRYITNFAYMRSLFWDEKRNDLPIKDHFVELIVEKSNLFGKKEGEKITLEEIFSKKVEYHQTILVSGGSGYGKTTLCKKIAYDWATAGISSSYLEHFDLVVVILLRELNDKSLYDFVLQNIFHNTKGEVKSEIETENLNILVMLDGFDEISNKSPVLKFIREESFDISLRMTILVTSRPKATEDIREDLKSRFSVEGFNKQQQQKYIELMFKDYEDKGKELFGMLKENEFVFEVVKCPLLLHMLCCVYQNDDEGLMKNMTDLYVRMFSLLIKRYISKYGGNYNFRKGKYFLGEDLLLRLGKSNYYIGCIIKDLKKLFPIEEEYNFIVGLGILEFNSFSAYDEKSYYQFVHLSFCEFIQALTVYFYFPEIQIADNVVLFAMGLYGREPFSKNLQERLKMPNLITPKFMLQAYREIKTKTNWELFCSLSCLTFWYYDLDNVKELLHLYDFTQMHFMFPECKSDYLLFRDKLINFYKSYKFSDKVVIFLFPTIEICFPEYMDNVFDFREIMSCIIDFFNAIGPNKSNIYFCGIYEIGVYLLREIKLMNELPKYTLEKINGDENQKFVALRFKDPSDHIIDCVVTEEQYETLRDRIITVPLSEQKHKCIIA